VKPLQIAVDRQIVIPLLGEVDAGVEEDVLTRQPDAFRQHERCSKK
jgi:hypothetical protein